jgi:formiminoglutamase
MKVSKESNFSFENDLSELINSLTNKRSGEIRIGEILTKNWQSPLVKYVIIGISESIGPQANYGRPGAERSFDAFLSSFCNLQWTNTIPKDSIAYIGKIHSLTCFTTIEKAKSLVTELDEFIVEILSSVINTGKIPIVIGGGHNNALPLIQCIATRFNTLSVINMDAHADCRALEGRHSGNSFSYGIEKGFLSKYGVYGLHKAYLNQTMTDYLNEKSISFEYFDNYSLGLNDFKLDIHAFIASLDPNEKLGVELDLDCIENFPSSAMNPIGFSISDARNYLSICKNHTNIGYYHLTEAAVIESGDERIVGKVLAQLTYDIITEFTY